MKSGAKSTKRWLLAVAGTGPSDGILTIIAFTHNRQIWGRYPGWIKTRRSTIPSLAVTKETLAQDFPAFLQKYSHLPLCFIINARLRSVDFLFEDVV